MTFPHSPGPSADQLSTFFFAIIKGMSELCTDRSFLYSMTKVGALYNFIFDLICSSILDELELLQANLGVLCRCFWVGRPVTMLNQFHGQRMKMDAESKAFQGSKSRLNPTR